MRARVATAVLIILAALVTVAVVGPGVGGAAEPSASPSPSMSPSATPTPEITPAPAATVKWARNWRRIAVSKWKTWNRARVCLGMAKHPFASPQPSRSASKAVWAAAGAKWKHMVRKGGGVRTYQSRTRALVRRMTHPGGSGAARWMPLARLAGWPKSCLPHLTYIIARESGGNPRAKNPASTASGLLQFLSSWWRGKWNPFDPYQSLRHGYKAWRQVGWQPWAL